MVCFGLHEYMIAYLQHLIYIPLRLPWPMPRLPLWMGITAYRAPRSSDQTWTSNVIPPKNAHQRSICANLSITMIECVWAEIFPTVKDGR